MTDHSDIPPKLHPKNSPTGEPGAGASMRPGLRTAPPLPESDEANTDWITDAIGNLERMDHRVRSWIRERPILSVASALGLGLAASVLAQRLAQPRAAGERLRRTGQGSSPAENIGTGT